MGGTGMSAREDANFVARNGIDDWVAGVHSQPDCGRLLLHDDGKRDA
jgi:hypothetical protein